MLAANPNPSSDSNRALMHALVDWVVKDAPPPPSRYPRLDRGDLVPPTHGSAGLPAHPRRVAARRRVRARSTSTTSAQASATPTCPASCRCSRPCVRQTLPTLVPRVDADGNEIAGVRSVLLEAPLGTYTGWNPVARGFFKGQIQALGGGYIPFAKTKAERLAAGDPRLSLEERYVNHEGYVARVKAAAARAVAERFLLQDDADRIVAQAEKSSRPALDNSEFRIHNSQTALKQKVLANLLP